MIAGKRKRVYFYLSVVFVLTLTMIAAFPISLTWDSAKAQCFVGIPVFIASILHGTPDACQQTWYFLLLAVQNAAVFLPMLFVAALANWRFIALQTISVAMAIGANRAFASFILTTMGV